MMEQKWILVKDRLPDYDEDVLLYDGTIKLGRRVSTGKHGENWYTGEMSLFGEKYSPTHWMILPEPPKA